MSLDYPWSEPPAPGATIDVAPGVQWLRMPLPFKLDHINLWLVEDGAGWAVIDTGVGLDNVRGLWEKIFAGALGGRPITRVLVTHFHPDHMGNAGWLTERWGTQLWCSRAEYYITQNAWRAGESGGRGPWLEHYRRNGCSQAQLAVLAERGNHYVRLVPTVPPAFRALYDGDAVTLGGRRWTMIVGHGHSPEHAAFWCAEADVLISGDQILPKITPNVSVWADQPWGNPLQGFIDSLERFRGIGAGAMVLPAHGMPFRNLPERLVELRTHHDARLAQTLDAITEPKSGAEVVPALFPKALDSHQLTFAFGETLAHLHYVEADGRAVRITGADGVDRFRKA